MSKEVSAGPYWFNFVRQLKEDSKIMKTIIKKGHEDGVNSNKEYSEFRQKTFNAIYGVKRKPATEIERVPKARRIGCSSLSTSRTAPQKSYVKEIEFEMPPTNTYNWPKRNSSAKRVFRPVKLNDYPNMKRKKDLIILYGAPVHEATAL